MKVYTDKSHYFSSTQGNVVSIVYPLLNGKEDEAHSALFEYVDNPADADIFVLPLLFRYYVSHHLVSLAKKFVERAWEYQKKVVVWDLGDLVYELPYDNVILLHTALDSRYRKPGQFAAAKWVEDLSENYPDGIPYHEKRAKPVVGFCGQAAITLESTLRFTTKNLLSNAKHLLTSNPVPPPLLPHTFFRAHILKVLSQSDQIETRFIVRQQFRVGAKEGFRKKPEKAVGSRELQRAQQARQDFMDNLNQSDYIVCMRGAGNWSIRFFETLAHGRIPVFFDTYCVLPYDFAVDWKQYCVWIDQSEIPYAAEKIADFHAKLSPSDFSELQHACYDIWRERLMTQGFLSHFHEHLEQLNQA